MTFSHSYVSSPVVLKTMNRYKFINFAEEEESDAHRIEPKLLKAKIRELARSYANFSNKDSEGARNVMLSLNKFRQEYSKINLRQHSRRSVSRSSSCPRCHGYGMRQFRHVEGGVCFSCGQMP